MGLDNRQFDDFDQWQDNFRAWIGGGKEVICFDTIGRRCTSALHFKRAKDEGRFPVRWIMADDVGSLALYSIGCRALKFHAENILNVLDYPPHRDEVERRLRDVLAMMDRVGTPAGANALHREMMMALLTDAAFDTVKSFGEFFEDVATWKSDRGSEWAVLMMAKISTLQQRLQGLRSAS